MNATSRTAIASILFALAMPAVVLFLTLFHPEGMEPLPEGVMVTGIVVVVFLSPLAAALFGHAAKRQIRKKGSNNTRGYALAAVGLGWGYIELACVALFLVGTPIDSNRMGHFEASAVRSLRTISRSEHAYSQAHP